MAFLMTLNVQPGRLSGLARDVPRYVALYFQNSEAKAVAGLNPRVGLRMKITSFSN